MQEYKYIQKEKKYGEKHFAHAMANTAQRTFV